MMNKQISLVLALSLLLSVPAFADSSTPATPTTSASAVQVATADFEGTITDITNKQITVRTSVKNPSYETIVFNLSRNTKFENCYLTELETGNNIVVTHSLAMTRSAVPQASALVVKTPLAPQATNTYLYEGTVKDMGEENGYLWLLVASSNAKEVNKEVRFIVSKDSKLTNGKLADLKKGMAVKLTYGPQMTMSLPPQTAALSLELVQTTSETVKVPMKRYEFEGKVTKIVEGDDETRITVTAKGSKGTPKAIVFIINANTDVEDEDDETLEVGATVEVTYLYASKQLPTTAVEALSIELD